jgi:hypothetical protein
MALEHTCFAYYGLRNRAIECQLRSNLLNFDL